MHFNIEEVQEFLNTQYNYVHDVEPVADGWWSQALTFYTGEEKLVCRINQHPLDFQKDAFAYERFNSAQLIIPEIRSIGNFNANYFYCISQFIEGVPSDRIMLSEDLTHQQDLATVVLDQLQQIHNLDTSGLNGWGYTGGTGHGLFNSWQEFLLSIHNSKKPVSWQELSEKTWLSRPLFEKLLQKMQQYFPFLPQQKQVLHGDYGFDNLLLTENNKVAAVIDWAEMMLGDAMYDLIHMCEPWKLQTGASYIDLWAKRMSKKGIALEYFEERMKCYHIHYTLMHLHIHTTRNDEEGYREIESWAMENL